MAVCAGEQVALPWTDGVLYRAMNKDYLWEEPRSDPTMVKGHTGFREGRLRSLGIQLAEGQEPCPAAFHYPPPGMWPSPTYLKLLETCKPFCIRCNDTLVVTIRETLLC
jgi:hypothetical protein